ncbi:TIM21-domain-containing protein [Pilobolus umbonatus]|nr:TIM21-domain-containing protein [Pilobolus umbonatus]
MLRTLCLAKQPCKRLIRPIPKRTFTTPAVRKTDKGSLQAKQWNELSTPQKVVAASKTTLNVGVILAGLALTTAIVYFTTSELFGSQSTVNLFSDAVDRLHENEEVKAFVGEPFHAHGEPSQNKRRRNRRIHSQEMEGPDGPHLFIRFYIEGPLSEGTVMVDMIKGANDKWEYKQLFVDVPGRGLPSKRIYVIRN